VLATWYIANGLEKLLLSLLVCVDVLVLDLSQHIYEFWWSS